MKVKVEDGWLVAVGIGGVARAETYEQACEIEKDNIKAMKWGIGIGVSLWVAIIILIFADYTPC